MFLSPSISPCDDSCCSSAILAIESCSSSSSLDEAGNTLQRLPSTGCYKLILFKYCTDIQFILVQLSRFSTEHSLKRKRNKQLFQLLLAFLDEVRPSVKFVHALLFSLKVQHVGIGHPSKVI